MRCEQTSGANKGTELEQDSVKRISDEIGSIPVRWIRFARSSLIVESKTTRVA
jgi:hypothetical protein